MLGGMVRGRNERERWNCVLTADGFRGLDRGGREGSGGIVC